MNNIEIVETQNRSTEIEDIEKLVKSKCEDGALLKHLNREIIIELENIKALKLLIERRLRKTISEYFMGDDVRMEQSYNEWFGPKVENFYLEKKAIYETVDFKLIRNKNKDLMLEIYQRLMNRESEWNEVSDRWGNKPESNTGGKLAKIKQNKLSEEMKIILKKLQIGEVSEVFRVGKEYAIVELIKWRELRLTEDVEKELSKELANEWIHKMCDEIIKILKDREGTTNKTEEQ